MSASYWPMTPTINQKNPPQLPPGPPLPVLTQPGSPPAKRSLERTPNRTVPVWYRRSRTFWAGGALFAVLVIAGGLKWKFSASTQAEDITATVKRANLSITVTERGELESSKTIYARCEAEEDQNKTLYIRPEGTKCKSPVWC